MLEISIPAESKAISDLLAVLTRRLGDLQPAMEGIGQELESRISARFETRTDPLGQRWAPWAQSTRDRYPADGHRQLLDRYGDMLRSLNWQASKDQVRIGFGAVAGRAGDVYAVYHEFGTEHMPRRGLLFDDPESGTLAPDDEAAVLDILGTWLEDIAS